MRRKIVPYNPALKEFARNLRANSTQSEIKLWLQLKGKQMLGFDFHRQKPIDNFILDFFCHELMLGIELDSLSHTWEEVEEKDKLKEQRMKQLGITILHFNDEQVMNDMETVLREIEFWILNFQNNTNTPR